MKKTLYLILFIGSITIFHSCKKNDEPAPSIVSVVDNNGVNSNEGYYSKKITGTPNTEGMLYEVLDSNGVSRSYIFGTYGAEGEPDSIKSVVSYNADNDTIVNYIFNAQQKISKVYYSFPNGAKDTTFQDYSYFSSDSVRLSIYSINWNTNQKTLLKQENFPYSESTSKSIADFVVLAVAGAALVGGAAALILTGFGISTMTGVAGVVILGMGTLSNATASDDMPINVENPSTIFNNLITIGDYYHGGVVFWVDPTDNTHGLICAESDQGGYEWYPNYDVNNANTDPVTSSNVGSGQANTNAIIANQGAGVYAASVCDQLSLNGYNDWFLPSADELNKLFIYKAIINFEAIANGGASFYDNYYWSSTGGAGKAWGQDFVGGSKVSTSRGSQFFVRAIRSF